MRWHGMGRGAGAACAIAGCMPMLAALVGGAAGSATANYMMGAMSAAPQSVEPPWIVALGQFSWPLLIVSAALLIWSFRRTAPLAQGLAYASVALLVINRLDMTPWVFFPAMAVLAVAWVAAYLTARRDRRDGGEMPAPLLH
jgi:hypothetical protein